MVRDGIKVKGHHGTWYVVDETWYNARKYYLLEHEQYGDLAACIIISENGDLVLEDVYNGFEDLYEYFD